MKKIIFTFCFIILGFNQVFAIPPPEFITQVFSNIAIYFAMWVAFISAFFWTTYIYLRDFYKRRKILVFFIISLLFFSWWFWIKYYFDDIKKKDIIQKLEDKKFFVNNWIEYENKDKLKRFKNLSTEKKINILMEEERLELEKYLFEGSKNNYSATFISNKEFKKQYFDIKNKNIFILDAREDLEFEMWQIPWSVHIRIADLKNMKILKKLDKTKEFIVVCWWWMRWKLTAEFLLYNGFNAKYLKWW